MLGGMRTWSGDVEAGLLQSEHPGDGAVGERGGVDVLIGRVARGRDPQERDPRGRDPRGRSPRGRGWHSGGHRRGRAWAGGRPPPWHVGVEGLGDGGSGGGSGHGHVGALGGAGRHVAGGRVDVLMSLHAARAGNLDAQVERHVVGVAAAQPGRRGGGGGPRSASRKIHVLQRLFRGDGGGARRERVVLGVGRGEGDAVSLGARGRVRFEAGRPAAAGGPGVTVGGDAAGGGNVIPAVHRGGRLRDDAARHWRDVVQRVVNEHRRPRRVVRVHGAGRDPGGRGRGLLAWHRVPLGRHRRYEVEGRHRPVAITLVQRDVTLGGGGRRRGEGGERAAGRGWRDLWGGCEGAGGRGCDGQWLGMDGPIRRHGRHICSRKQRVQLLQPKIFFICIQALNFFGLNQYFYSKHKIFYPPSTLRLTVIVLHTKYVAQTFHPSFPSPNPNHPSSPPPLPSSPPLLLSPHSLSFSFMPSM